MALFPTLFAFRDATILDGTRHMEPQPHMSVIVCEDDGVILDVVPDAEAHYPTGMGVRPLDGKFVVPGLVNLHAHLAGSGDPAPAEDNAALVRKLEHVPLGGRAAAHVVRGRLKDALQAGVTCLRGAGDPLWSDVLCRNRLAKKERGPRVVAAGWGITPPGGHGAGIVGREAATPEEARAQVRELAKREVDVVKLFVTGGVYDATEPGEPGVVRMSQEMADAIVEEAHGLGLPTLAHAESAEGVRVALRAGVDSIEHGAPLDDELLELFRCNGAGNASTLTCTLSPAVPYRLLAAEKTRCSPLQKSNADAVYEGIVTCARQALQAGIAVGLGTDAGCPYVAHTEFWRELLYFDALVAHDPQLTLHLATQGNARILEAEGVQEVGGVVAPQERADLLVLDGNPLEDLSVLRDPVHVVGWGRLIEKPRPHRDPELIAQLDQLMEQVLAQA